MGATGKDLDAVTKKPIPDAVIDVTAGIGSKVVRAESSSTGNDGTFIIKNPFYGPATFSITVKKPGYFDEELLILSGENLTVFLDRVR